MEPVSCPESTADNEAANAEVVKIFLQALPEAAGRYGTIDAEVVKIFLQALPEAAGRYGTIVKEVSTQIIAKLACLEYAICNPAAGSAVAEQLAHSKAHAEWCMDKTWEECSHEHTALECLRALSSAVREQDALLGKELSVHLGAEVNSILDGAEASGGSFRPEEPLLQNALKAFVTDFGEVVLRHRDDIYTCLFNQEVEDNLVERVRQMSEGLSDLEEMESWPELQDRRWDAARTLLTTLKNKLETATVKREELTEMIKDERAKLEEWDRTTSAKYQSRVAAAEEHAAAAVVLLDRIHEEIMKSERAKVEASITLEQHSRTVNDMVGGSDTLCRDVAKLLELEQTRQMFHAAEVYAESLHCHAETHRTNLCAERTCANRDAQRTARGLDLLKAVVRFLGHLYDGIEARARAIVAEWGVRLPQTLEKFRQLKEEMLVFQQKQVMELDDFGRQADVRLHNLEFDIRSMQTLRRPKEELKEVLAKRKQLLQDQEDRQVLRASLLAQEDLLRRLSPAAGASLALMDKDMEEDGTEPLDPSWAAQVFFTKAPMPATDIRSFSLTDLSSVEQEGSVRGTDGDTVAFADNHPRHCFVPMAQILTPTGWVPVASMALGTELCTITQGNLTGNTPVTATSWQMGVHEVVTLSTAHGSIQVTASQHLLGPAGDTLPARELADEEVLLVFEEDLGKLEPSHLTVRRVRQSMRTVLLEVEDTNAVLLFRIGSAAAFLSLPVCTAPASREVQ